MGVKLGKLNVKLVTETAQFNKGMDRSRQKVSAFSKTVRIAGAAIKAFAAVLASVATFGIAIFIGGIIKATKWVDTLAKTADKLGTTTENLASMQLAAELAGISVETFNMALQRMVRRVADAAAGGGPAAETLKQMGLDAQRLNRLDPYEQLTNIVSAMDKIGSQGNRVKAAFSIFDSEGVSMVNLTAQGLQDAADALERMDGAIGRADASLLEEVNNQLTLLGYSFKSMFAQLAIQLAPFVTEVLTLLSAMAPNGELGAFIGKVVTGTIRVISQSFTAASALVLSLWASFVKLESVLDDLFAKLVRFIATLLRKIADLIDNISKPLALFVAALTKDPRNYGKVIGYSRVASASLRGAAAGTDKYAEKWEGLAEDRKMHFALLTRQYIEMVAKNNKFWNDVEKRIDEAHAKIEASRAKAAAEKAAADKAAFNEKFLWGPLRDTKEFISGMYGSGKTFYKDLMAGKYKPEPPEGSASAREAIWSRIASGTSARSPEMQQLDIQRKSYEALKALLEETQEINNKTGGVAVAQ